MASITRSPASRDEAGATSRTTVLDEQVLAALRTDLGETQFLTVLQLFGQELEQRMLDLARTSSAGDLETLRSLAHGVKGSAVMFGAPVVSVAARRLEDACRDLHGREHAQALTRVLLDAIRALAERVRGLTGPGGVQPR
jgi:HPt (histidine-containing phosphotransfer) domain-containing protein